MAKRSFRGYKGGSKSGFGAAFIALGTLFILPSEVSAQTRSLTMPDELCSFQPLSNDLIARIQARSDYPRILQYLSATCPEVALIFTDAPTATTASIAGPGILGGGDVVNLATRTASVPDVDPDDDETPDDDLSDDDSSDDDLTDDDSSDDDDEKPKSNKGKGNNDEQNGGGGCGKKATDPCADPDNPGKGGKGGKL